MVAEMEVDVGEVEGVQLYKGRWMSAQVYMGRWMGTQVYMLQWMGVQVIREVVGSSLNNVTPVWSEQRAGLNWSWLSTRSLFRVPFSPLHVVQVYMGRWLGMQVYMRQWTGVEV